jgi:rubrerythrin
MELKQAQTIELMAQNEEIFNRLYVAYASKYPEYKDFWIEIANEETNHASWLRDLKSQIEIGNLSFADDRFDLSLVFKYLEHAKQKLDELKNKTMPIIEALKISLAMEKSLLENKFFEVVETDQIGLKSILFNLAKSTEEHIQKIEDLLKKVSE